MFKVLKMCKKKLGHQCTEIFIKRKVHNYQQSIDESFVDCLQRSFDLTKSKAKYILFKYPAIGNLNEVEVNRVISVINEFGLDKKAILSQPNVLKQLPITLHYRRKILLECGFKEVSIELLCSFLSIVRKYTVEQLKKYHKLDLDVCVQDRLVNALNDWPISRPMRQRLSDDSHTLFDIRMKVLQRYFELNLDMTMELFHDRVKTYPRIKHKPFKIINENLCLLQSHMSFTPDKIVKNFYLLHSNPENTKLLLFKLKTLAGIDIKEILRKEPKLCDTNYNTFIEIMQILREFKIPIEAQTKCFEIYTLASDTVRRRLEEATTLPEFKVFFEHPRILNLIFYEKKALLRLGKLYESKKKCSSLDILAGGSRQYNNYLKSPGDKTKGTDLIKQFSRSFGKGYTERMLRNTLKRHPFWVNAPLVEASNVFYKLEEKFKYEDIYLNCFLLLYPWIKVNRMLNLIQAEPESKNYEKRDTFEYIVELKIDHVFRRINFVSLSDRQILSLALYLLEKQCYFSGNGIWL